MNNQFEPEYVQDLFNKMSGSYERMNYITSFGFSLLWRKQFLKPLKPSGERLAVLDLMTGMGETWHPVKKHFPNSEFTALDFSEGMLGHARRKNENQFQNQVIITNQNALKSNFEDGHFDVVLSAFGLKTFNGEQLEQLAKEVKRILKPGGVFSFIEVSSPKNGLLRTLYKTHLKYVVPFCGRIMLGNPEEYRMLWKYTVLYQNSEQTRRIFEAAGLEVNYESYFGGCASGISGRKS